MAEVEVRSSGIEGHGMFACRSFRPGERIGRVNVIREITTEAPIRPDVGESVDHCSYPDGRVVLWGSPDRHVNHSCDPNAWLLYNADVSPYFVARRDIAAGDEITCDYSINAGDGGGWPCSCGSARCRGVVVGGYFGLPAELQREYRPFLAEWFVRRNRERLITTDLACGSHGPTRS